MILRDLVHLLGVATLLAAILALAEGLRRRGHRAEVTRKLVHAASGLLVAAFPWLFASAWSVAALAGTHATLMAWTHRSRLLQSVHGVRRRTTGPLHYATAVVLVFLVARRQPEAYVPSILVLALADAAAALVGSARGRVRYRTIGGTKSVEGSLAFFALALPCIGIPLLVWTTLSPPSVLMWSGLTAAVACGIEALAPRGSDNLLVPTTCCLILLHIQANPALTIWIAALCWAAVGTLVMLGRQVPPAQERHARLS